MEVTLDALDASPFSRRGIYGSRGDGLPRRFRWLQPEAAETLRALEVAYPAVFRYSDVFRDADGSRRRREKNRAKRGRLFGMLPGYSGHNFGLCTDDDVDGNLRRLRAFVGGKVSKRDYDAIKRAHGWWCHRDGPRGGDHRRGHDDWHFNFLGDDSKRWLRAARTRTSGAIEAKLLALHGREFRLGKRAVQQRLKELGFYAGQIDGRHGPLTRQGVRSFQRAWTLRQDGSAGPRTQRVLAYVTARFVTRESDPLVVA